MTPESTIFDIKNKKAFTSEELKQYFALFIRKLLLIPKYEFSVATFSKANEPNTQEENDVIEFLKDIHVKVNVVTSNNIKCIGFNLEYYKNIHEEINQNDVKIIDF